VRKNFTSLFSINHILCGIQSFHNKIKKHYNEFVEISLLEESRGRIPCLFWTN